MKTVNSLDRIRIASPCSVGWENMSGDERVRFCNECSLHVYNISEMTGSQALALMNGTEGRLCAMFYRRADGTILTKDCPVGLKAFRRRVSRRAGALLTAILSLCTVALGQSRKQESKTCPVVGVTVKRESIKDKQRTLAGVVKDATGAVITGAQVTIINQETKEKAKTTSDSEGAFGFPGLPAGTYTLEIEVAGFTSYRLTDFDVSQDEAVIVDATLQAKSYVEVFVGMITTTEPITVNEDGSRTISGDMLRKLPIN